MLSFEVEPYSAIESESFGLGKVSEGPVAELLTL